MIKIFIPYYTSDSHIGGSPYVYTYTDEILKNHSDISFIFESEFLWSKECEYYTAIHFMFPSIYGKDIVNNKDFDGRLKYLKKKGVKIIATCHNLVPHYSDEIKKETYKIVYQNCDLFIHLGEYSLAVLEKEFPNAKHIIIQHHVYNTIYGAPTDRVSACKRLKLSCDNKYVLCLGDFRAEEERQLIINAARILHKEGINILAPRMYSYQKIIRKNPKLILKAIFDRPKIVQKIKNVKKIGIHVKGSFVNDDEMLDFMGASDIVLVQRLHILNSGNVPLGMYFSKVVVGPNDGNVARILSERGNPVFDPFDTQAVVSAVRAGLSLSEAGKGIENKEWIMKECTTEEVSEMHYNMYKAL